MNPRVTAERLRQVLNYNPDTGVFTWAVGLSPVAPVGSIAGTFVTKGFIHIGIDRKYYAAHRLAWLYVYGEWPSNEIDHRNLNKSDNRISNLRIANNQGNSANRRALRNNRLGVKGVGVAYRARKATTQTRYRARIRVNDKLIHIGYYHTKEAASAAYLLAARKHFGEFARSA